MGQYSGWAYTFYGEISGIFVLARRCSGVNGYVLEKYFKKKEEISVLFLSVCYFKIQSLFTLFQWWDHAV